MRRAAEEDRLFHAVPLAGISTDGPVEVRLTYTTTLTQGPDRARPLTLPLRGLGPLGRFSWRVRAHPLPSEDSATGGWLAGPDRDAPPHAPAVFASEHVRRRYRPVDDLTLRLPGDPDPTPTVFAAGRYRMLVGRAAWPRGGPPRWPPENWLVLIDTSASAGADWSQRAPRLAEIIREIGRAPGVRRVDLAGFDIDASVLASWRPGLGAPPDLRDLVAQRGFRGATDIDAGLLFAESWTRRAAGPDAVVLFSDGRDTSESPRLWQRLPRIGPPGAVQLVTPTAVDRAALRGPFQAAGGGRILTESSTEGPALARRLLVPPGQRIQPVARGADWLAPSSVGDVAPGREWVRFFEADEATPVRVRVRSDSPEISRVLPARGFEALLVREARRARLSQLEARYRESAASDEATPLRTQLLDSAVRYQIPVRGAPLVAAAYSEAGAQDRLAGDVLGRAGGVVLGPRGVRSLPFRGVPLRDPLPAGHLGATPVPPGHPWRKLVREAEETDLLGDLRISSDPLSRLQLAAILERVQTEQGRRLRAGEDLPMLPGQVEAELDLANELGLIRIPAHDLDERIEVRVRPSTSSTTASLAQRPVTIECENVELVKVISRLSRALRINILVEPTQAKRKVTLNVKDAPGLKVLKLIAKLNRLQLRDVEGDGSVYVIAHKNVFEETICMGNAEVVPLYHLDATIAARMAQKALVNAGNVAVEFDATSNSLIVSGSREPIEQAKWLIAGWDKSAARVLRPEAPGRLRVRPGYDIYEHFRGALRYRPLPKDRLDHLESLAQAFDASHPPPGSRPTPQALALDAESGLNPYDRETHSLRLVLRAGRAPAPTPRPARRLVLVIDADDQATWRHDEGLYLRGLRYLTRNLDASDELAVVTFEDDPKVALPVTTIGDRTAITGAIEDLKFGGADDPFGGLARGLQVATDGRVPGLPTRVLLLTDSAAPRRLALLAAFREQLVTSRSRGLRVSVARLGPGTANDATFGEVAALGGGTFTRLESPYDVQRLFALELPEISRVTAEDIEVSLEFDPEVVEASSPFSLRPPGDTRTAPKPPGTLGSADRATSADIPSGLESGQTASALYRVRLRDRTRPLGFARIRYRLPGATTEVVQEVPLPAPAPAPSPGWRAATLLARLGAAIASGKTSGLKALIPEAVELAKLEPKAKTELRPSFTDLPAMVRGALRTGRPRAELRWSDSAISSRQLRMLPSDRSHRLGLLNNWAQKHPEDPVLGALLADAYRATGDLPEARRAATSPLDFDKLEADEISWLAHQLAQCGGVDLAARISIGGATPTPSSSSKDTTPRPTVVLRWTRDAADLDLVVRTPQADYVPSEAGTAGGLPLAGGPVFEHVDAQRPGAPERVTLRGIDRETGFGPRIFAGGPRRLIRAVVDLRLDARSPWKSTPILIDRDTGRLLIGSDHPRLREIAPPPDQHRTATSDVLFDIDELGPDDFDSGPGSESDSHVGPRGEARPLEDFGDF